MTTGQHAEPISAIPPVSSTEFAKATLPARSMDAGSHSRLHEKELRLALVCYGGVSLAVYMHGITVELQRLVHASYVYCASPDSTNPFADDSTERVYWDALSEIARTGDKAALRVVIDVIAGTSAGGINGVALAKALAHGLRQDPLRQVWFDQASLLKLLLRSPWRIFREGPLPPLDGQRMTRWAHDALQEMNKERLKSPDGSEVGSLIPQDHELDLFITTTDCSGYRRTLDLYDPENVHDLEYRHVLRFSYDSQRDHFDAAHDRALTLAIRCTSSFPGAFPPVSLAEMSAALGEFDDTQREAFHKLCFPAYLLEKTDPEGSLFIDGGVLNNRPFDHAVRAVFERPASHEVDRRLLFIEPHPVEPTALEPGKASKRPSWGATILRALTSIPSHQPVVDALLELARHDERAAEIKRLIALTEPAVEELIRKTAKSMAEVETNDTVRLYKLSLENIDGLSRAVQDEASRAAGAGYLAYHAIKLGEVVRDLATGICMLLDYPSTSRQALMVRRVLDAWAQSEKSGLQDEKYSQEFLKAYDLNFRRRRLRFLIRYVNSLYHGLGTSKEITRRQLDGLKAGLYQLINILRHIQGSGWVSAQLKSEIEQVFGQETLAALAGDASNGERSAERLTRFLGENQTKLNSVFSRLEIEVTDQLNIFWKMQERLLNELLHESGLPERVLQVLLSRYVGFPYWDAFIYPLMALSDVAELDEIEVIRVSPADTRLLQPRGAEQRLKGVAVYHFGAFLNRAYRENDYLWGRLDGVERLLAILGDVAAGPDGRGVASASRNPLDRRLAWRGFAAVLAEERPRMTEAATKTLIQNLQKQVDEGLAAGAAAPQPAPLSPATADA